MKYPRIFATSDGESRFEDVGVPLEVTQTPRTNLEVLPTRIDSKPDSPLRSAS